MTSGFLFKWKQFFQGLELHDSLNIDLDSHIWLLHHLFLSAINTDALEWAEAWNSHSMAIRGERQRSPRDMFLFGMIQNGSRGLDILNESIDEDVEDIESYGIDWEAFDDRHIRAHHGNSNPADAADDNPFLTRRPEKLSDVEVIEPNCPLSPEQRQFLDVELQLLPFIDSRSMELRRLVWVNALAMCQDMFR
jgi:hypothetical protein